MRGQGLKWRRSERQAAHRSVNNGHIQCSTSPHPTCHAIHIFHHSLTDLSHAPDFVFTPSSVTFIWNPNPVDRVNCWKSSHLSWKGCLKPVVQQRPHGAELSLKWCWCTAMEMMTENVRIYRHQCRVKSGQLSLFQKMPTHTLLALQLSSHNFVPNKCWDIPY